MLRLLAVLAAALLNIPTLLAQTWQEQGPRAINNGQNQNVTPNTVSGAINSLAVDPGNAGVVYAGTINGGVWKTTDGGTSWNPLTDNNSQFKSLAVSSVFLDPADVTNQTLVGSYGRFSSFASVGGPRAGVIRSTDGGANWSFVNGTNNIMAGTNLYNVVANGSNLVASANTSNANTYGTIGVFRSSDGGANWAHVSGNGPASAPNGLPGAATFQLVQGNTPATSSVLLTATRFASQDQNSSNRNGVYRSTDGGATWALTNNAALDALFGNSAGNTGTLGNVVNAKMAFGPNNTAYVGLINTSGQLGGLFRSTDNGATWSATSLDVSIGGGNLHLGGQGGIHFAMTADPVNSNLVYLGGDRQNTSPFPARAFRVNAGLAAGSQASLIVLGDTSNNSGPHADVRDLKFTATGGLLMANDGGIFLRANLTTGQGQWNSINGDLRDVEVTGVAYDRLTKALYTGQQDNGMAVMQSNVNVNTPFAGKNWTLVTGGDGGRPVADALVQGGTALNTTTTRYFTSQNLGSGSVTRRRYDANNVQQGGSVNLGLMVGAQTLNQYETANYGGTTYQFINPMEANSVVGGRLLVGTRRLYESTNFGDALTDVGGDLGALAGVTSGSLNVNRNAIAAGGRDASGVQSEALYVGAGNRLFGRSGNGGSGFRHLANYATAVNDTSVAAVMDTAEWRRLYVVNPGRVWFGQVTNDTTLASSWANITGNLTPGGTVFGDSTGSFTDVEFVPVAGQPNRGAVLVGTSGGLFFHFNDDGANNWFNLNGTSLPNTYVFDLDYDFGDDVLVVGGFGRGVWTLPNASQFFAGVSVPEPAAVTLGVSSVFGAGWYVRRRRLQRLREMDQDLAA